MMIYSSLFFCIRPKILVLNCTTFWFNCCCLNVLYEVVQINKADNWKIKKKSSLYNNNKRLQYEHSTPIYAFTDV